MTRMVNKVNSRGGDWGGAVNGAGACRGGSRGTTAQARSGCVESGPEDRALIQSGVSSRLGYRILGGPPIDGALVVVGAGKSHGRGCVSREMTGARSGKAAVEGVISDGTENVEESA